MLRLGKVYFKRYPDSSPDRIMENVHAGYHVVRVCLIEKLLDGIEEQFVGGISKFYNDVYLVKEAFKKMKGQGGEKGAII